MKILYIGYEGFDTKNGTNHLIKTMLKHFLIDHEVIYINSHSSGDYEDVPNDLIIDPKFRSYIIKKKKVKKSRLVSRFLVGKQYNKELSRVLKKNRFFVDIVIVQSTPTAYQLIKTIRKHVKAVTVLNSFDIFPDGITKFNSYKYYLIKKYFQHQQIRFYSNVDYIICNSCDVKETFIKKGVSSDKLFVVYNWYDSNHLSFRYLMSENNAMNTIKNVFIVQYAGNFGFTFDHTVIVKLAKMLEENKNIRFQMIGDGVKLSDFRKAVEKEGLRNVEFLGWQSEDRIIDYYRSCNIQIVPLEKNVIYNSYPSKVSLILALSKIPIVVTERDSRFNTMFSSYDLDICYENTELYKIAKKIKELSSNSVSYSEMSRKCRYMAEQEFSSKVNLKRIDKLLEYIGEHLQE